MNGLKKLKKEKSTGLKADDIRTHFKKIVDRVLTVSLIDLQFTYVLAFLGREQIAESLSKYLVAKIIAVVFIYAVKSYSGKRNEEDLKYLYKLMKMNEEAEEDEEE
jgi:hypothetical protein